MWGRNLANGNPVAVWSCMCKQTVNDKQSHLKGCFFISERSRKADDDEVAEDDPTEGLASGTAADQPCAACPLLFLSLNICSISLMSLDSPHWQLWNSRFQPTMRHVLFKARIRVRSLRGCQKLIILRSITFYCKIDVQFSSFQPLSHV